MPEFVSVLQDGKSKTVVTVTKERAKALGLRALSDEPAVNKRGRPLGPREAKTVSKENPK